MRVCGKRHTCLIVERDPSNAEGLWFYLCIFFPSCLRCNFICAFSFCHFIYHFSPSQDWITTQGRLGNFHAVRPLDKTHTYTHAVTQTSAGVSLPSGLDFPARSSSYTCPGAWGRYRKVWGLYAFIPPLLVQQPLHHLQRKLELVAETSRTQRERGSRFTYPIKVCTHQGSTCGKPCCYHYIKASNQRSKRALYLLRKIRRLGNYIFLLLCIMNNRK